APAGGRNISPATRNTWAVSRLSWTASRRRWSWSRNGDGLAGVSQMSETKCSFCGKREDEVGALVPGPPPVFICDGCVNLCQDIIGEGFSRSTAETTREPQVTEAELKAKARLRAAVVRVAAEFMKRRQEPELVLA